MKVNFYISQSERGKFVSSCEAIISAVGNATKSATETACKAILTDSLQQVPRDTGTLASTAWYHVESAFMTGAKSGTLSSNRFVGYVGYAGAERTGMTVASKLATPSTGTPEKESGMNLFPRYSTKFKQFQGQHHPGGRSEPSTRAGFKTDKWGIKTAKRSRFAGYSGHGVQNAVNPKNGLPASAYAAIVHEDLNMPHPNGGKAKFLEDPVRDYASSKFRQTVMNYWKYAINWSNMGTERGLFRVSYTEPTYFESKIVQGGSVSWKGDSL